MKVTVIVNGKERVYTLPPRVAGILLGLLEKIEVIERPKTGNIKIDYSGGHIDVVVADRSQRKVNWRG